MNNDRVPETKAGNRIVGRKKLIWSVVFAFIAVLSIFAVISQSKSFSIERFADFIKNASLPWLICAAASMLAFIFFEGAAICTISRAFGYNKKTIGNGSVYSASDIYFSAITPSATGGQPASAYFMIKDGIPAAVTTAILLINLLMYCASIIVIGLFILITNFDLFLGFSAISKILIIVGFVVQTGFGLFFTLLITKKEMLRRICTGFLRFLAKLHIIKRLDKKTESLDRVMTEYGACLDMIRGHNLALVKAFVFNLLQRSLQIAVTLFTFLATGGALSEGFRVWSVQAYTVLASNCVPIPGAMGVTDYLMLDGFGSLGMAEGTATNLELLSRSLSFYICILICGVITLLAYILKKKKNKGE